jgi:LuxR family maltose regulon positive regulatory protein
LQLIHQNQRLSAWLSLDKHVRDLELFLRYLLEAIRKVVPGFGPDIEPLLSSPQLPPSNYLAEAMVSALCTLEKPLFLFLDDYHSISSEPIQEMVIRIVQLRPKLFHLVVLTRSDPPWPLSLWRGRGWLNEIGASDISFTREETQLFFQGQGLPDEIIQKLQNKAEGWITGLQLFKLSLANVENPQQFIRNSLCNDRIIVDYLMEEVISKQPTEILDFLIATSSI